MASYSFAFILLLGVFCVTIFVFVRRPLYATMYLLWFRSTFAVASFLHFPELGQVPFFAPAYGALWAVVVLHFVLISPKSPPAAPVLSFYIVSFLITISSIGFVIMTPEKAPDIIATLAKYLLPIPVYFGIHAGLKTRRDFERLPYLIVAMVAIPVAVGLLQAATGTSYDYSTDKFVSGIRPVGTIIDANAYGIFLSMSVFLITPFAIMRRRPGMKAAMLATIAMILLAQDRGTWIAAAIAVALSIMMFSRYINVGRVIGVGLILALAASPILLKRFSALNEVDQFGQSQNTLNERLEQSQHLFSESLLSPIVGHGAGLSEQPWGASRVARPPHDDYVRVFYEFGLPILAIYIFFLLNQLYDALTMRRLETWRFGFAFSAFILYLMIISATQNILYDSISYSLILLMMATMHRTRETNGFTDA